MNERRRVIGAARGRIEPERIAVYDAAQRARRDHGEQFVVPCVVTVKADRVPYEDHRGKHEHEKKGADGERSVPEKEHENGQRHVHDEREIPRAESESVLHHGGDAAHARGREFIRKNKYVIRRSRRNRQKDDEHVGHRFFEYFRSLRHFLHPAACGVPDRNERGLRVPAYYTFFKSFRQAKKAACRPPECYRNSAFFQKFQNDDVVGRNNALQ